MDSKLRFSNRVTDYVKFRPSYPSQIIGALREEGALPEGAIVADMGAGTGLLSEIFLRGGFRVIGIEPNAAMRAAGAEYLAWSQQYQAMDGSAEQSGLSGESVDLVVAGQAFHWFDAAKARVEFARILRQPRWVALIWNARLPEQSPFQVDYDALLRRYASDYGEVSSRRENRESIGAFFTPGTFSLQNFANRQSLNLEGFLGRLRSSSYTPPPGAADHDPMMAAAAQLFDVHQRDGTVTMEYQTQLFSGRLQ